MNVDISITINLQKEHEDANNTHILIYQSADANTDDPYDKDIPTCMSETQD